MSVFYFHIPFSVFIADGELTFIDRFVSFNPVRKVAHSSIQRVQIRDVQHQARVLFTRREQHNVSVGALRRVLDLVGLLVNLCKRRKHLFSTVTTPRSYVQSIFSRFRKGLIDIAKHPSLGSDAKRFLLCRRQQTSFSPLKYLGS